MPRSRLPQLSFAVFGCAMLLVIGRNDRQRLQTEQFAHLVSQGNVEGVRRLLAAGADPDSHDGDWGSMLRQAVCSIHGKSDEKQNAHEVEIALLLLQAGANPNRDEDLLRQALEIRLADKWAHTIVPALLAHGARLKAVDLCAAAYYGDAALVKDILDRGGDPNKKDMFGDTPLGQACQKARIQNKGALLPVVTLLLERGADPNAVPGRIFNGDADDSVLESAVYSGNKELVGLLLAHGADVNWKDKTGDTVLMAAVNSKTPAVARLLLQHGADVRARNSQGRTALRLAKDIAAGKAPWRSINARETRTSLQIADDKQVGSKMVQILRQAGAAE